MQGSDSANPGRVEVRGGGEVHLSGDLDRLQEKALHAALEQAHRQAGSGFLVDLTGVTFLDSAVESVLFAFVDRRPRLRVRAGSLPERVMTITGLGELGLLDVVP